MSKEIVSSPAPAPQAPSAPTQASTNPQAGNPWSGEPASSDEGDSGEVEQSAAPVSSAPSTAHSPGEVAPVATPTPASTGLTADQFKQVIEQTIVPRLQPQAPPQPQMTQAEFNQKMNIVEVTPEMCQEIGLPPESAPKMNALVQAIAKQAMTVAAYHQQLRFEQLQQQFAPVQSYMQQQQEQALRSQFMEANPQFKGYEPLLENVYAKMIADGFRANTPQELFAEVTRRGDDLLKKLNLAPSGSPTASSAVPSRGQATPGKSRMSPLPSGGQGGTGRGAGQTDGSSQKLAAWLFSGK